MLILKKLRKTDDRSTNSLNLAYENAKIQLRNNINTINAQKKNAELARKFTKARKTITTMALPV